MMVLNSDFAKMLTINLKAMDMAWYKDFIYIIYLLYKYWYINIYREIYKYIYMCTLNAEYMGSIPCNKNRKKCVLCIGIHKYFFILKIIFHFFVCMRGTYPAMLRAYCQLYTQEWFIWDTGSLIRISYV